MLMLILIVQVFVAKITLPIRCIHWVIRGNVDFFMIYENAYVRSCQKDRWHA